MITIDKLATLAGRHPRVIRRVVQMIERPTARDRRRLGHWRLAVGALEDLERR